MADIVGWQGSWVAGRVRGEAPQQQQQKVQLLPNETAG